MKRVITRTKEEGRRSYTLKCNNIMYPSISKLARGLGIPKGTLTKHISRKYLNQNQFTVALNGYTIEVIAYD